jgi:hypothetical protein
MMIMRIKPVVAALATAAAVAFGAAGCDVPLIGTKHHSAGGVHVVVGDVSASTTDARTAYATAFNTEVRALANERATLVVILAAGDPLEDVQPMRHDFATDYEGQETKANADLATQANTVAGQFRELLEKPPVRVGGTALLRAFVAAARQHPRGITAYTDGVENSRDLRLDEVQFNEAGLKRALDQVQAKGLLPNLRGVPVRIVLPGYHPGGGQVDPLDVQRFWEKWAKRTGAQLTYG